MLHTLSRMPCNFKYSTEVFIIFTDVAGKQMAVKTKEVVLQTHLNPSLRAEALN